MTRLDEIRERHAARLRTRAAKGDGSVQMSTLVDDDVAWLLGEVGRLKVLLQSARDSENDLEAERAAVQDNLSRAVTRIDEIEKWATDHFGDSTDFPTDLAFAFWGMPSAADLPPVATDAERVDHAAEHYAMTGSDRCWCAEESP